MYFYLAMVGFEPTPTSTAAPSNTETTVIPSRPLRSLKRSYHGRGLCLISLHYTSDRVTRFRCANTIIYIYKEYLDLMDTKAWKQYIKLKIYKLHIYIYINIYIYTP